MIDVKQTRAQKAGANKQENVGLLGIETDQGHHAHQQGQESGHCFHHGVELSAALPGEIPQNQVAYEKSYKES